MKYRVNWLRPLTKLVRTPHLQNLLRQSIKFLLGAAGESDTEADPDLLDLLDTSTESMVSSTVASI